MASPRTRRLTCLCSRLFCPTPRPWWLPPPLSRLWWFLLARHRVAPSAARTRPKIRHDPRCCRHCQRPRAQRARQQPAPRACRFLCHRRRLPLASWCCHHRLKGMARRAKARAKARTREKPRARMPLGLRRMTGLLHRSVSLPHCHCRGSIGLALLCPIGPAVAAPTTRPRIVAAAGTAAAAAAAPALRRQGCSNRLRRRIQRRRRR
mmetsp:Transcript_545/g.2072  ORF Transcript_545/g.2072 Transcript_545/m.2072 type:complete len:207 (-) Transcript_545:224-844(-)